MGSKRTYNVEITEIKHFDIDIEAESEKEALTKARISYFMCFYPFFLI